MVLPAAFVVSLTSTSFLCAAFFRIFSRLQLQPVSPGNRRNPTAAAAYIISPSSDSSVLSFFYLLIALKKVFIACPICSPPVIIKLKLIQKK
jgi:hypothetical protein